MTRRRPSAKRSIASLAAAVKANAAAANGVAATPADAVNAVVSEVAAAAEASPTLSPEPKSEFPALPGAGQSSIPHGGVLKDLVARDAPRHDALVVEARSLPSIVLTERQLCDLELILNGAFSPLEGFLGQADYESVVSDLRLADGTLWPMPVTLDVSPDQIDALGIVPGARIALRNPLDGRALAILTVADLYRPDKAREAELVFGKNDTAHPAVAYLHTQTHEVYVGGRLDAIALPSHYDFVEHRFTPRELREWFAKLRWTRVVAFQTRNPMHRAHRELTVRAAREQKCNILIHPVVGLTKPGDIDHYTRVRVYKALLPKYPQGMAALSLLPLAMRMGGPREAVWHAIIRKNFGCTHFIVGRDHAGPGKDSNGNDFYGPYDAQDLVEEYRDELHITVVPFQMVSYVPDTDEYVPSDKLQPGTKTLNISGTELRRRLKTGAPIPDWFTYPEVQQILRSVHPPRSRQGFVVLVVGADQWATGVVGRALENVLNQSGQRAVTLLAREIGASLHAGISSPSAGSSSDKAVESVAFVAGEIAKAGGAVVVATDLPTERARKIVRDAVESRGGAVITAFITDTPDSGESFFEAPAGTPEVVANARVSVSQAVHEVVLELEREGFVGER